MQTLKHLNEHGLTAKCSERIIATLYKVIQVSEKNFPNDARIVTYIVDGKKCYDLTRGRKIVNIFDMYWDKYKHDLKSIDFGYGNLNPKLWGNKPKKDKKKK